MFPILAKYGTSLTLPFALHVLDGSSFQKGAVHAAGDTLLSKNEGIDVNTTNGYVDGGASFSGYSIVLTATEMQAARLLLMIEDQSAPKVWLSRSFTIFTFGNASAHIAFDLSPVRPSMSLGDIAGSTVAAVNLGNSAAAVVNGTAVTGTLTTTKFSTNLTGADGFYVNRTLVWISGALAGQATRIARSENTSGMLYVIAMTGSPANTDQFVIV